MKSLFGPTPGERMLALAIQWLVLAVAVWVAAELVTGITLEGWRAVLLVSLILGLLNVYVKPVLVALSLPVTMLTFGLFLIVINTVLLMVTDWFAGELDLRFNVEDFWAALLGAIVISIVTFVIGVVVHPGRLARNLTHQI